MKIPVLGWAFAEDFFTSKTTHLAMATVVAAVTAVTQHKLPVSSAFIGCVGSLAIAFLRDSSSKDAEMLASLLSEGMNLAHLDVNTGEPDGEADAPVTPTTPVAPTTPTTPTA